MGQLGEKRERFLCAMPPPLTKGFRSLKMTLVKLSKVNILIGIDLWRVVYENAFS